MKTPMPEHSFNEGMNLTKAAIDTQTTELVPNKEKAESKTRIKVKPWEISGYIASVCT
jgi:hypothetical protein